jgi:hypothetical protein
MTEHEQLHEQREQEADDLERESERLGEHVAEARKANEKLESDDFVATPADDEPGADDEEDPPPEAEYPAKD